MVYRPRATERLKMLGSILVVFWMHSSRRAPAVESKAGIRKSLQLKVCKNPHTVEIFETKGGNHKGLKEWESEHGSAIVESWLTK